MEGHVNCVIYRPVGPVDEMQGVQERVCEISKVLKHEALKGLYYRGQSDRSFSPLILSFFGDGMMVEASWYMTCLH